MLRNKYIRFSVSTLLILLALWVATPKVYIHNILHHAHPAVSVGTETTVQSPSADDCDFENYNKPVYFSIFKFIFSFIPQKPSGSGKTAVTEHFFSNISVAISFLRGPPVNQ